MSDQKIDDLPKVPHSAETVMKAMGRLHKLVLKQSAAYGGKNSKYIPAQVLETSLLKSVDDSIQPINEGSEVDRLLDLCHSHCEELVDHFKGTNDKKGMGMLGRLLDMLGAAVAANNDGK